MTKRTKVSQDAEAAVALDSQPSTLNSLLRYWRVYVALWKNSVIREHRAVLTLQA